MAWIKIETTLPDKPEVWQLAELLDLDPDAVTGKLLRLWSWADSHLTTGDAPGVTKTLLDRVTGVTGFAQALATVGWLRIDDSGVTFVNFERHNGKTAKTRALTAKRNDTWRKGRHNGDASTVTGVTQSASPEKRREENINTPHTPRAGGRAELDSEWEQVRKVARTVDTLQPYTDAVRQQLPPEAATVALVIGIPRIAAASADELQRLGREFRKQRRELSRHIK